MASRWKRPFGPARGFTLIELMIAVVIVGLLAAIAYPSYRQHVYEARRAEAKAALIDVAQRLERCYSSTLTYENCPTTPTQAPQYYSLTATNISARQYTLTATPINVQLGDTRCASFTLDQAMSKGAKDSQGNDATSVCW